jgi:hypothetical protein
MIMDTRISINCFQIPSDTHKTEDAATHYLTCRINPKEHSDKVKFEFEQEEYLITKLDILYLAELIKCELAK